MYVERSLYVWSLSNKGNPQGLWITFVNVPTRFSSHRAQIHLSWMPLRRYNQSHMKMWRPVWDTLVTLLGAALLLVLALRELLPAQFSALLQPGTFFAAAVASAVVLFVGVVFGTVRHKEASPILLSGLGVLCLLLPLPASLTLQVVAVLSFVTTAVLSVAFHTHSLDIPRAPSMEDLLQDAL